MKMVTFSVICISSDVCLFKAQVVPRDLREKLEPGGWREEKDCLDPRVPKDYKDLSENLEIKGRPGQPELTEKM